MSTKQSNAKPCRMIVRLKPLDSEMWSGYRGLEIAGSLVTLGLIRDYWQALFPRFGIILMYDDDQGLYDTLYHNLFFMMRQRTDLGIVQLELKKLVRTADDLPTHADSFAYDDDIMAPVYDDLRLARSILNKILIAEGGSFGESRVDGLFASFADEINARKAESEKQALELAVQLKLAPPPKPAKPKSRAGRPPIALTYEDAQLAYWDVFDGFEAAGESRKPSQLDICDHLASRGKSVGVATFQARLKKWRATGLPWPPPRPELDT